MNQKLSLSFIEINYYNNIILFYLLVYYAIININVGTYYKLAIFFLNSGLESLVSNNDKSSSFLMEGFQIFIFEMYLHQLTGVRQNHAQFFQINLLNYQFFLIVT